jgi:hypothetical protein
LTVYINFGNEDIRHKKLVVEPGISALDALAQMEDIEYTPDESATYHHGAMVTAINGFKVDLNQFWIYYVFEHDQAGWTLLMCTPDLFQIANDCRLAWRYHSRAGEADMQRYGPLWTCKCISKIKRCNWQF